MKKRNTKRKILKSVIVTTIGIFTTLFIIIMWLDSPRSYYNNKGELVQEYTEKATYIGNNQFLTDDGNVWNIADNTENYKINKKYKVYFMDAGTEYYVEDDKIIYIKK